MSVSPGMVHRAAEERLGFREDLDGVRVALVFDEAQKGPAIEDGLDNGRVWA